MYILLKQYYVILELNHNHIWGYWCTYMYMTHYVKYSSTSDNYCTCSQFSE